MVGVGDTLAECESWRELGMRLMRDKKTVGDWERASGGAGF